MLLFIGILYISLLKGNINQQKLEVMQVKWVHYDREHLMNVTNGMIVLKTCDLNNIQPIDIKGFDILIYKPIKN